MSRFFLVSDCLSVYFIFSWKENLGHTLLPSELCRNCFSGFWHYVEIGGQTIFPLIYILGISLFLLKCSYDRLFLYSWSWGNSYKIYPGNHYSLSIFLEHSMAFQLKDSNLCNSFLLFIFVFLLIFSFYQLCIWWLFSLSPISFHPRKNLTLFVHISFHQFFIPSIFPLFSVGYSISVVSSVYFIFMSFFISIFIFSWTLLALISSPFIVICYLLWTLLSLTYSFKKHTSCDICFS